MFPTPAHFAELQKGQMDAAVALSQTFFDAAERLMELNLAAAKATLEESVEKTQALLSAKDAQELFALSTGNAQPTLEKAVSYSRTVYGIANGANAEVSRIVEAQITESNKKVAQLIDFAAKNAPAGSEPAVTAFKSAVAAVNTAYDTFAKATKQAVEMAELNVAAAKATLEESVEKSQALLSAKDVQEMIALSSNNAQPTLDKAVSYSRPEAESTANASKVAVAVPFVGTAQTAGWNIRRVHSKTFVEFAVLNMGSQALPWADERYR